MSAKNSIVRLLLFFCFLKVADERPLNPRKHLYNKGYLKSTDVDNNTMTAAIKEYQKYHNLQETGNLDENTRKQMSQPCCGMQEIASESSCSFQGPKWRKYRLTYRIRNWTTPLDNTLLENIFDNVINQWTEGTNLHISKTALDNADIDVFVKNIDSEGGTSLAYAYSPENGDIYFDSSQPWAFDNLNEEQVYVGWVAAHELGHSLGLPHDVKSAKSVMYPCYEPDQTGPSEADKTHLKYLYREAHDLKNEIFCNRTSVDAMLHTIYNNNMLIKGAQFWHFNEESLEKGPFPLDIFYPGLPDQIDAALSIQNNTYFFKDEFFYKYSGNEKRYRKKFITIGFENVMPTHVDAAFFDPNIKTIYFFKGAKYYGFDISKPVNHRLVVDGKKISEDWIGIPENIESASYIGNNKVLFVKNMKCYTVDSVSKKLLQKTDCSAFFKCPNNGNQGSSAKRTKRQMTKRRCGRPDNVEAIKTAASWKKRHLTYKIRNSPETLTETEIKNLFDQIIKLWTSNVSLHISESRVNAADIDVYFDDLDGQGNLLGYAHFPENGNIHFDNSDDWSLVKNPADNEKIYGGWLVAHELGHSLGLDHEDTMQSIMYPEYNTEQTEPSLADIANLKKLYEDLPLNTSKLCQSFSVDAMLYINGQDHILIKDQDYWHFFDEKLESGPYSLNDLFPELPNGIDAALSVKQFNYFLKGDVFYRFKTGQKTHKTKLINVGFENMPGEIDGSFYEPNSKTINFFKGSKYYMFDAKKPVGSRLVVNGTNISEEWKGVPDHIEAATYLENGTVLFVKNGKCYTAEFSSRKLLISQECTNSFFRCNE